MYSIHREKSIARLPSLYCYRPLLHHITLDSKSYSFSFGQGTFGYDTLPCIIWISTQKPSLSRLAQMQRYTVRLCLVSEPDILSSPDRQSYIFILGQCSVLSYIFVKFVTWGLCNFILWTLTFCKKSTWIGVLWYICTVRKKIYFFSVHTSSRSL